MAEPVAPEPHAPVKKCVGGVEFVDDVAWLQPDSAAALAWQAQANAAAADAARHIPGYATLRRNVRAHLSPRLDSYARQQVLGGRHFSLVPFGEEWHLCVAESAGGASRVLVDSARLTDQTGRPVRILFIAASPDGRKVAFTVSRGGQHTGDWCVADVGSGEVATTEVRDYYISNCNLPGWLPDASGFLLGDRAPDGRHAVRFVLAGTQADARTPVPAYRIFTYAEVPLEAPGFSVQVSPGGRYAVGVTEPHHRAARVLWDAATDTWRPFLPEGFTAECQGEWLDDETYVAVVNHDAARGRVVAIPAATSRDAATWRSVVPEGAATIRTATVIQGRIVVAELRDVALALRTVWPDGRPDATVPLPEFGMSPSILVPRRFERSEELLVPFASFFQTLTWYHFDLRTRALKTVAEPADRVDGVSVTQQFAVSRDGTRVPYFRLVRSDLADAGAQPTLVNAYGGFNAAWMAMPLEHIVPFIRAGGVYVHANLRGGGEYGRDWHEAGRLANLQNSFDDLFAVAEDLIRRGQAETSRLAFQGHSHGGLLAGVAIVQRPDLWRCVCPTSPLLDMMEPLLDGPARTQVNAYYRQHYGDAEDSADAPRLFAISPLHNIRPGTRYPAVYAVFGEHDVGCPPYHGRKFVARLRAATKSGRPVHLRVWKDVGHGAIDLEVAADYLAEWLAFTMHELGLPLDKE